MNKNLLVRRINVTANNIVDESKAKLQRASEQLDLFGDFQKRDEELKDEQEEKQLQKSILEIKRRYGKNAIVKGMNLQEAGTTIDRNAQVGGHRAQKGVIMGKYDDIINLPHYEPKHHPRMSMYSRAAQFAPFAALTGYDEQVKETARLTDTNA